MGVPQTKRRNEDRERGGEEKRKEEEFTVQQVRVREREEPAAEEREGAFELPVAVRIFSSPLVLVSLHYKQ